MSTNIELVTFTISSIAASIAWESEQVNATRGVKKESEGGGMVRVWKGKGGVES